MDRRNFIQTILAIGAGGALGGCSEVLNTPLKIAVNDWVGYIPLRVAADSNELKDYLQIVDFPNNGLAMKIMTNNTIDGYAGTIDEVLKLSEDIPNLKIACVIDVSNGADVLITKQNINHIKDLKGKTIGVEIDATGNYFLARILNKAGLTKEDINIVNTPPNQSYTLLQNNQIDAMVSYAPHIFHNDNKFKTLFSSKDIYGEITDVLVISEDSFKKYKKGIQIMHSVMGKYQNITLEQMKMYYPNLTKKDFDFIKNHVQYIAGTKHKSFITEQINKVSSFMLSNNLITEKTHNRRLELISLI